MHDLTFEITLKPAGRGLLWALWTISEKKGTGILTIEWERFRKQMAFRHGEPIATKSNWLTESFGQYLVRLKKFDANFIQTELQASDAAHFKGPLGEWLMSRGHLQGAEVFELLSTHFRDRLFNLLALSHGNLEFKSIPETKLMDVEPIKLTEPFRKLLWDATKQLYTDAVCKGKLAAYLMRKGKVKGDFPFPLPAQDLRMWNGLKEDHAISQLQGISLQLFAAATEFDQVEFAQSDDEKFFTELKSLSQKFAKMKLHEVLGVDLQSDASAAKKSYLELVKKYHPDRLPVQHTAEMRKISEALFAKINEAYSVMTDAKKKEEYVATLQFEDQGGVEGLKESLEAEMLIPQAKMALRRRHFAQALEMYKQIYKSLPNDGEVKADLAYCEMMSAVDAKADIKPKLNYWKEEIKKAITLNPKYADALYYRGLISKFDGSEDRALSDFDQALQINPRLTEAASEARLLRMRKEKKGGLFKKS